MSHTTTNAFSPIIIIRRDMAETALCLLRKVINGVASFHFRYGSILNVAERWLLSCDHLRMKMPELCSCDCIAVSHLRMGVIRRSAARNNSAFASLLSETSPEKMTYLWGRACYETTCGIQQLQPVSNRTGRGPPLFLNVWTGKRVSAPNKCRRSVTKGCSTFL
jgi:hypothetical protein